MQTAVRGLPGLWQFISLRLYAKMTSSKLDAVQTVDIDHGVFKYVLIRLHDKTPSKDGTELSKTIIRGYKDCEWHTDIYERCRESVAGLGLDTECLGGGRIEHIPDKKYMKIYGYSQGFGKADHNLSKKILLDRLGGYDIETSDDGY